MSQGKLQFDLWGAEPDPELALPWQQLRDSIAVHGVRNSLLVCGGVLSLYFQCACKLGGV